MRPFTLSETHHFAETSSPYAAPDACMAANQNLPGSAVVGQVVLGGVSVGLEMHQKYLARDERCSLSFCRPQMFINLLLEIVSTNTQFYLLT